MLQVGNPEQHSLPSKDVWDQAEHLTSSQLQDMFQRIQAFEDESRLRAHRKAIIQARHGGVTPEQQAAIYDQRPRRGSINNSFPKKSQRAIA